MSVQASQRFGSQQLTKKKHTSTRRKSQDLGSESLVQCTDTFLASRAEDGAKCPFTRVLHLNSRLDDVDCERISTLRGLHVQTQSHMVC